MSMSASARPGGGGTFRGSSSSGRSSGSGRSSSGSSSSGWSSRSGSSSGYSSSGGGGDGGAVFSLLVWALTTRVGLIGVVAIVVLLVCARVVMSKAEKRLNWEAGVAERAKELRHVRSDLERLREHDANFSVVLLEDFLNALYGQAYTLRGGGLLGRLSAYLQPPAQSALGSLGPAREVKAIIVGAMRFVSVDGLSSQSQQVRMEVEFESNYTEVAPSGAEQSFYACERWELLRDKQVLSRTPDRVRVFTCPACGAPLDGIDGGVCKYCSATVDTGRFDWVVSSITVTSRETRGPMLTGDTAEQGTDLPTVIDDFVQPRYVDLTQRDPQFVWPAFQARVGLIFQRMQLAWSNRDVSQARPFVSDNLFQMLAYWTEAYRKAALRNVTEQAQIEGMELVRVTSDRFYDALTIRLRATSLDFTIADADGRIVAGSRNRRRRYTEYWTLIRGVNRKGTARSDATCPSCGAPLAIEMAGNCAYCRARVTSGEFDWVLSRIEQDEVYEG